MLVYRADIWSDRMQSFMDKGTVLEVLLILQCVGGLWFEMQLMCRWSDKNYIHIALLELELELWSLYFMPPIENLTLPFCLCRGTYLSNKDLGLFICLSWGFVTSISLDFQRLSLLKNTLTPGNYVFLLPVATTIAEHRVGMPSTMKQEALGKSSCSEGLFKESWQSGNIVGKIPKQSRDGVDGQSPGRPGIFLP